MYIGVDIGGTNIKYGVIDDLNNIIFKDSLETRACRTDREIVADIIAACREMQNNYPVQSIGIGSPGHISAVKGLLVSAANLPFHNTPVVSWVQQQTGLPVRLGNDANCAALGEFRTGINKDIDNMVLITLGTGIGGGIIINRQLYLGNNEAAGEIGHISIDYAGLKCRCGRTGCFEAYASVNALIDQTRTASEQYPDSLLAEIASAGGISGKTAFEAAKAGCPVAAQVIARYIQFLAVGINDIVVLLQPDLIVLAGGITNEGANLLDPLRAAVDNNCELAISTLKNDAGMIGAALLGK